MISVVIATIPGREALLERAIRSVNAQTYRQYELIVEVDYHRTGAAATRNKALEWARGRFLAVLDDDDEFLPNHLEELAAVAVETGADVVYSDFYTTGTIADFNKFGHVPTYTRRGLPFDAEILRKQSYIPVTSLYRTDLVKEVGGWSAPEGGPQWEDWGLYLKLLDRGAKFHYHQSRTWIWNFHPGQTGGK